MADTSKKQKGIGTILAGALILFGLVVDIVQIASTGLTVIPVAGPGIAFGFGIFIDIFFVSSVLLCLYFTDNLRGSSALAICIFLLIELIPVIQAFPCWTIAMFFLVRVSRKGIAGIPLGGAAAQLIGYGQKAGIISGGGQLERKGIVGAAMSQVTQRIPLISRFMGAGVAQPGQTGKQRATINNRAGSVTQKAGKGVEYAGQTAKYGGKAINLTGKGMEASGKVAQGAGKGVSVGGTAMVRAGVGMSGTGLGAIVGIPLAALGGVTYAAGKTVQGGGMVVQGAGKVTEAVGTITEKSGQAVASAGKAVEEVGSTARNVGNTVQQAGNAVQKAPNPLDSQPSSPTSRKNNPDAELNEAINHAYSQNLIRGDNKSLMEITEMVMRNKGNTLNLQPKAKPEPENHLNLKQDTNQGDDAPIYSTQEELDRGWRASSLDKNGQVILTEQEKEFNRKGFAEMDRNIEQKRQALRDEGIYDD